MIQRTISGRGKGFFSSSEHPELYRDPLSLPCNDYWKFFPWRQSNGGVRGSIRSTWGLGPTMTVRGQSIGISIGMLPQTLIMLITVQKTSKYYTTEFDLEEGF